MTEKSRAKMAHQKNYLENTVLFVKRGGFSLRLYAAEVHVPDSHRACSTEYVTFKISNTGLLLKKIFAKM